jgi:hypothetical protein
VAAHAQEQPGQHGNGMRIACYYCRSQDLLTFAGMTAPYE